MSTKLELFLEKFFSIENHGSNEVDAVRSWLDSMSKRFVLVNKTITNKEELDKQRRRNLIIAVFVVLSSFKYLDNLFVNMDASYDVKLRHGAMFHSLGFGGKVLLIAASCCVSQSGLFRILFWSREKKNQVQFLTDFSSFQLSSILTNDVKQSFSWKMNMYHRLASVAANISSLLSICVTIIMGVHAAYPSPTLINITIWTVWVVLQNILIYFVIPDLMILGCFWFVMRIHVKMTVKQIVSELHDIRQNKQYSRNRKLRDNYNHHFGIWFSRYNFMRSILVAFDDFSKYFMLSVSSTSSIMCSAFLFGLLMTDDILVKIMLIPMAIFFTTYAVVLMSAATSINSLGKTLHKELNTVFVRHQHKLSIEHKTLLNQLIEHTGNERYPSVSLMTVNGTPFESTSFATFIVSFITLFLMMFDFLHQVF